MRVGRVDRIELGRADRRTVASVTFRIQRTQQLYTDTEALIHFQDLIGRRYLALAPGTDPARGPLAANAVIPLDRTEPSFDLSGLLGGFQPLFDVLDAATVNRLSHTIVQALQGDRTSLALLVSQVAALAGELHRRDRLLTDVIVNLSNLMAALARHGDHLETLLTQTRALVDGLHRRGQQLMGTTAAIADATGGLAALTTAIAPKLDGAQTATTAALTLLLGNGARLDDALVDITHVVHTLGQVSDDGTYADAYLCGLDVSLYDVLLPPGVFARIGGNAHSPARR